MMLMMYPRCTAPASEEQGQGKCLQAPEKRGPVHPPEQDAQENAADGQLDQEGDARRPARRVGGSITARGGSTVHPLTM